MTVNFNITQNTINEEFMEKIFTQFRKLNEKLNKMASKQDLQDALDAQSAAIAKEVEQINAKLQELQDALTNGASPAELQTYVDQVKAKTAAISGIIPDEVVDPGTGGGDGGTVDGGTGTGGEVTEG